MHREVCLAAYFAPVTRMVKYQTCNGSQLHCKDISSSFLSIYTREKNNRINGYVIAFANSHTQAQVQVGLSSSKPNLSFRRLLYKLVNQTHVSR